MKKTGQRLSVLVSLALLSGVAFAEAPGGFIGVYTVPDAKIKIENQGTPTIKDSGTAYGVVAELDKDQWFGYVHYETVSIDINALPQPGVDAEEYRVGLGWRQKLSKGSVQASLEYFGQQQEFDFPMVADWDDAGVGVHVNGEYLLGLIGGKVPVVGFADVGYIKMDKSDAEEYRFGFKSMLSKHIGVMTAYRIFKQEKDESKEKTTLNAMNIGVSYVF